MFNPISESDFATTTIFSVLLTRDYQKSSEKQQAAQVIYLNQEIRKL